ncbi:MAG: competence protein ComEC [Sphingobium sp.]|nr:MAG: competence protein ComEC [Sphingobium sp.]
MAFAPRQTSLAGGVARAAGHMFALLENMLEREREQIGLWAPVALAVGISAWFLLPGSAHWLAFCCLTMALVCGAAFLPTGTRVRQMCIAGGMVAALGCVLIWGKAAILGQPPLARPVFTQVTGTVQSVRPVPAQAMVRATIRPIDRPDLPETIRVNIPDGDKPAGLGAGAVVRFRSRLMPPAQPSVPGGYDFASRAYFLGIGATGKALKPIDVLEPSDAGPGLRARLFDHILNRVGGPAEGIAAALATGDQGAIPDADADAMRRSGLAHLLSISGLHVTALIGAVIFLFMRVLALSRHAALDWPLMMIAGAGGALAGIGYTLLTGAEVPTVRSCIAALLVLGGLAMGRDAITLRLVATGALVVLAFWPEAVVGPSFQMSFMAVTALVALGEHRRFRAFAAARDERRWQKVARMLVVTLATGFVVEVALMPIALFHFHKAGLLGAFANIVAIPLTTFVVMPLEAAALLLDVIGAGAPFWWLTQKALDLLLLIAHGVASSPMATMQAPTTGAATFGFAMAGLLWILLWRGRMRWWGAPPLAAAVATALFASPPDLFITGDGRHVAVRTSDGMVILRDRAGDYVRDSLSESAGFDGKFASLADHPAARCSTDLCAMRLPRGGRIWRLLFTRSRMQVDRPQFEKECGAADIIVSDRRLPGWCRPRWLKADSRLLRKTGGLSIDLRAGKVRTVIRPGDAHPWIAPTVPGGSRLQLYRRSSPASLP